MQKTGVIRGAEPQRMLANIIPLHRHELTWTDELQVSLLRFLNVAKLTTVAPKRSRFDSRLELFTCFLQQRHCCRRTCVCCCPSRCLKPPSTKWNRNVCLVSEIIHQTRDWWARDRARPAVGGDVIAQVRYLLVVAVFAAFKAVKKKPFLFVLFFFFNKKNHFMWFPKLNIRAEIVQNAFNEDLAPFSTGVKWNITLTISVHLFLNFYLLIPFWYLSRKIPAADQTETYCRVADHF